MVEKEYEYNNNGKSQLTFILCVVQGILSIIKPDRSHQKQLWSKRNSKTIIKGGWRVSDHGQTSLLFLILFFNMLLRAKPQLVDTGPTSTNVLLKLIITRSWTVAVGLRVRSCCEENLRHWRGGVVHPSVGLNPVPTPSTTTQFVVLQH